MSKNRLSHLLVLSIIFIIYSGTLSYPWHFDDLPNITQNLGVQIANLAPETLYKTLFASPDPGHISRPIAFFSFALNWYFGQSSTYGYHIVNIFIHILTALILFHTLTLLLKTPRLSNRYSQNEINAISLLTTILWAAHPIQIQAVTYLVQRMTALAALFFLWGIFWYLKCHFSLNKGKRIFCLAISFFCYVMALGSKENAVLLPFSLLIIEFSFFNHQRDIFTRNLRYFLVGIGGLLFLASFYYIFAHYLTNDIFSPIGFRPYSLYERLITQPRVLIYYLTLIFYPLPARLSIDHSLVASTNLLHHWTTLPAIGLVFLLFVIGSFLLRNKPLIGFAIVFFFINHIIESSIIPLEMIFEHRNYLPSLFLFLPFAILLNNGLNYYKSRNTFVFSSICVFISFFIFLLGWGTYLRNNIWSSQEILWADALKKSPDNARPLTYLGQVYGWEKPKSPENLARAVNYYKEALDKQGPNLPYKNAMICNIAGIYFNYQFYEEASFYYKLALDDDPKLHKFRFAFAQVLTVQGKFAEALEQVDYLIKHQNEISEISSVYNLRGLILLWMEEPNKAITDLSKAVRLSDYKYLYGYDMGVGLSKAGYFKQADWFLKQALKHKTELPILLSLIENSIRAGDYSKAEKLSKNLFTVFNFSTILQELEISGNERYRAMPIDTTLIKPIILKAGQKLIENHSKNNNETSLLEK